MLRITRLAHAPDSLHLRVEGRLVGDWVQLLETEVAPAAEGGSLSLDLAGVEFADQRALAVLQRLEQQGVAVVACSPWLQSMLGRSQE